MTSTFHLAWQAPLSYCADVLATGKEGRTLLRDAVVALERTGFDFVLLGDLDSIGSPASELAASVDTSSIASYVIGETSRLGVVTALSTEDYAPYLLARLIATLDHASNGRSGWSVLSTPSFAAGEQAPEDRLIEYLEVVRQLWTSWEPDAVVVDRENMVYAQPAKVHEINFEGTYYRSLGPLVTSLAPQDMPVVTLVDPSPTSGALAYADLVVLTADDAARAATLNKEIREAVVGAGREPDAVTILLAATPDFDHLTAGTAGAPFRIVGSTAQIAAEMGRLADEGVADGFVLSPSRSDRIYLANITDDLVPVLRSEERIRSGYAGGFLRHNLGL
ncbi:LLM class flavin-dependent oxidoreductase [Millisia brevis]|uniref:LLM class flavin-dependent oxidoreductase n=1 Tax=Millisia brevis TaxID=264148 RepID=UPI000830E2D2|nr:LLM class flavin-dependent oxidoreductase [Millisia brevis]